MQPLPISQIQWSKPGIEHHEEDASQGEGDGKEGGLEATEAVVGRGLGIGHYIINFSTFIERLERCVERLVTQLCV